MSFEMCWSAMFITLDSKDRFALENFSTSGNTVAGNEIVHIHSTNGRKLLLKCVFPKWLVDRAACFAKGEGHGQMGPHSPVARRQDQLQHHGCEKSSGAGVERHREAVESGEYLECCLVKAAR